jgi:orotate phosphoribosyltransferase
MVQTEKPVKNLTEGTDLLTKTGALLFGDFTLASGRRSKYYFDSKLLTLDPEGASFVSLKLLKKLESEGIRYIGGTAYGAIPIVSQIALRSALEGRFLISAFYHRKNEDVKGHGTKASFEGRVPGPETPVAILEDVVTTGDSLARAIDRAKDDGFHVTHAIVLLDRDEGGRKKIEDRGYKFWSLYTVVRSPNGDIEIACNAP